ncbi:MAG: hypothetical protein ACI9GW_000372 [Halieaceae bacterium]|jgi:hypothetical protein
MERLHDLLIPATGDPCFGLHCSTLRETLAKTAIFEKIVGDMGAS